MQPHPIRTAGGLPPAPASTPPERGTTETPRGAHAPLQAPAGLPPNRPAAAAEGAALTAGPMAPRSASLPRREPATAAGTGADRPLPHPARFGSSCEAPAGRREALRAELRNRLDPLPFSPAALQDLPAQRQMQERYLDRAAVIAERRERAFGTVHPYRVAASMNAFTREGSLAAANEGLQSTITSAFRSPSGGALRLSVADNQDFFPIHQALVTATIQGAMAYVAEGVMAAANSRAQLHNLPRLARNKFDDLLYEQGVAADTVLLVVRNGMKEFMPAGDPRAATAEALAEQSSRTLSGIRMRQDLLDGKSFAFALVPLASGAANTVRRLGSTPSTLASPAPLFATSALASGLASGVVKFGLELGKTRAQVEIDDLVGGRQAVNLFRLSPPRPDAEPARWSDAGGLPRFLGEAARESLALAGEAARTWAHSVADLSYRYVLVNGIANMASVGVGGMVGQLFRPGRHFGPVAGESPQSRAELAGQMAQSTLGDAIWRGMKEAMKGREMDTASSLALRRTTRMAEQLREAARTQGELRTLVATLPLDSALWAARPLLARAPAQAGAVAIQVEPPRSLRATLGQAEPMDLPTLQRCRAELAALDLREATPQEQAQRDELQRLAGRIMHLLQSRATTGQWLQPRP